MLHISKLKGSVWKSFKAVFFAGASAYCFFRLKFYQNWQNFKQNFLVLNCYWRSNIFNSKVLFESFSKQLTFGEVPTSRLNFTQNPSPPMLLFWQVFKQNSLVSRCALTYSRWYFSSTLFWMKKFFTGNFRFWGIRKFFEITLNLTWKSRN